MDCRTALELLEAARPGTDDLSEPELQPVGAHLQNCPRCEAAYRRRQTLDRAIGHAIRDVPVPSGLKQRLLDRLEASPSVETSTAAPSSAALVEERPVRESVAAPAESEPVAAPGEFYPAGRSRRRWGRALLAAAAGLVVAFVGVWQFGGGGKVGVEELREIPEWNFAALPEFDNSFSVPSPYGWTDDRGLHFGRGIKGVSVAGRPQMAAARRFRLTLPHSRSVEGILLIIPKSRVRGAVTATSISDARSMYRGKSEFASAAWAENEMVYVCFAESARDLELLQRALRISPT